MSGKRVLLISYYFPPLGGAGISRPRAIFRQLTQFGYDCHVLTVKPVLYRVYEPELLEGLDTSKIFRSGSWDPSRIMYLMGARHVSTGTADKSRVITKRFFPDAKAGWIKPAIALGKRLCKKYRYDLIVSTSPPISAHLVAQKCSHVLGIPWAADFQDYWVLEKAEVHFESTKSKQKAKQLLTNIRSSASAVVANNESVGQYVGATSIIPNCYDSELVALWRTPTTRDRFVIGLFGTIAESNPVDPLLKVLDSIKKRRPNLFSKIRVLQVGQVDLRWLAQQLIDYEQQHIFEIRQYQSRKKAIELLSEAALFYFGLSADQGWGITPIRIYTLLASGRPILAYAPAGSEIDKIVAKYKNSFRFDDNAIDKASDFVCRQAERFLKGDLSFNIVPDGVARFSSERMVEKFARLFDEVLGKSNHSAKESSF